MATTQYAYLISSPTSTGSPRRVSPHVITEKVEPLARPLIRNPAALPAGVPHARRRGGGTCCTVRPLQHHGSHVGSRRRRAAHNHDTWGVIAWSKPHRGDALSGDPDTPGHRASKSCG